MGRWDRKLSTKFRTLKNSSEVFSASRLIGLKKSTGGAVFGGVPVKAESV